MPRHAFLAAYFFAGLATVPTFGQHYTFTRVADSTLDGLNPSSIGAPSVNASRQVAFSASTADDSISKVFRSGPAGAPPLVLIADSTFAGVGSVAGTVSLNSAGAVAFWGTSDLPGVEEAIFRGSGGALDTIVDTGPAFNFLTVVPSLNDSGTVAFQAELDGPSFAEGLFVGSGGSVVALFRTDTGPFNDSFASPSINTSGQIAFRAVQNSGPEGIFRYDGGATYVTIVDDTGPYSSFFDDEPSMNASGAVAVLATSQDFNDEFLLVGSGAGPALPAVDTFGPYADFSAASLNDSGHVAFLATLDDQTVGIFTGPLPESDRVIAVGDALEGSVVEGLAFFREGLANDGAIAFTAYLADGRAVVMLASSAVCLANCDGSTTTPILTANDFQCFINKFAAGDPASNCDGSTIAPALNANDFQCFLNQFAAGCS